MTPREQREKEILETIGWEEQISAGGFIVKHHVDLRKLASYLYKLESRLDDLYKILTPSQRIEIEQHKTPL